jgi:hypothetical protein
MKKIIYIFLLFAFLQAKSQAVYPAETYIRTCISDIECSSIGGASHFFYDELNGMFYIKIDFASMKTGQDTVDFWLNDLADNFFYFKASLSKSRFPTLSPYNTQTIRLDGQMSLNNIWRNRSLNISLFRIADPFAGRDSESDYESYRVNLSFSFSPRDFNIHKKPQRLTSTIFVGISSGRINILKPGMEAFLGEAYDRH